MNTEEQEDFCDHCGTRAKHASGLVVVETAPTEDFHDYIKRCGFNVHVFQSNHGRYFSTLRHGSEQVFGRFPNGLDDWIVLPYCAPQFMGMGTKEEVISTLCDFINDEAAPFIYVKKRRWPMKDIIKEFPPTGRLVIHDPLAQ